MTFNEAKNLLAQKIADAVNESDLPPTACRMILNDIDMQLEAMEEEQYRLIQEEKKKAEEQKKEEGNAGTEDQCNG